MIRFWPLLVEGTKLLREYFSIDSESIEKLTAGLTGVGSTRADGVLDRRRRRLFSF